MKRPLLALALATLLPAAATAATDGTLGDTSAGTLNLTLNVTEPGPQIQITALDDISVEITTGDPVFANDFAASERICVFMSEQGQYSLTVSATSLTDGAVKIPYQIRVFNAFPGGSRLNLLGQFQVNETGGSLSLINLPASTDPICRSASVPQRLAIYTAVNSANTGIATLDTGAVSTITLTVTPQ